MEGTALDTCWLLSNFKPVTALLYFIPAYLFVPFIVAPFSHTGNNSELLFPTLLLSEKKQCFIITKLNQCCLVEFSYQHSWWFLTFYKWPFISLVERITCAIMVKKEQSRQGKGNTSLLFVFICFWIFKTISWILALMLHALTQFLSYNLRFVL